MFVRLVRIGVPTAVVVISALLMPKVFFIPGDAGRLYEASDDELHDIVNTLERRGVAHCQRHQTGSAGHARVSMTCDVQGFAWRTASVSFSYIQCPGEVVRYRSAALRGFRVSEARLFAETRWPCPGDDAGIWAVP